MFKVVGIICLIAVAFAAPTEKSDKNDQNHSVLQRTSIASESHGHDNPTHRVTSHRETVSGDGKKQVQHHERSFGNPSESEKRSPYAGTNQHTAKDDHHLKKRDTPLPLTKDTNHHSSHADSSEQKKDLTRTHNEPEKKKVKRSPVEKYNQQNRDGYDASSQNKQTPPTFPVDHHKQDSFNSQRSTQPNQRSGSSYHNNNNMGANNHNGRLHKRSDDHKDTHSHTETKSDHPSSRETTSKVVDHQVTQDTRASAVKNH